MKRTLITAAALTALFASLNDAEAGRRGGVSRRSSGARRTTTFRRTTNYRRNTNNFRRTTTNYRRNTGINTRRVVGQQKFGVKKNVHAHKNFGVKKQVHGHKNFGVTKQIHGHKHFGIKKPVHAHKHFTGKKIVRLKHKYVHHYHLKFGKRFQFGYKYVGKVHHHWTKKIWIAKYGTYCNYCPHTHKLYYWCAPHGCFYPVSYCPTGVYAY